MIPFTRPSLTQVEYDLVQQALRDGHIVGNGPITREVESLLKDMLGCKHVLLVTSCTHALELAMMALRVGSGDEVILPSFAFVSAATAIVRQGARPVFADINERSFNLEPDEVVKAISPKTKAIMVVHYAGQGYKLSELLGIAEGSGVCLVEDAAQALGATYDGQALGTVGDIGCFSFHATKNVVSGEGGAFVANEDGLAALAEIMREKGTDRSQFLRGEVDKYTWQDIGSSYVISDLLAALLLGQLSRFEELNQKRRRAWWFYHDALHGLEERALLIRPWIDPRGEPNWHIYAIRVERSVRDRVLAGLRAKGIGATFHFLPLHRSPFATRELGYQPGDCPISELVSDTLIRLPLYPDLSEEDQGYVVETLEQLLMETKAWVHREPR